MSQDQKLCVALQVLADFQDHDGDEFCSRPTDERIIEAAEFARSALTVTQHHGVGDLSNAVLAALDALGDDAAVHIFPDDLDKCGRSECVVEVCSVRAGSPTHGKTVPLFSREQVATALLEASEQPAAISKSEPQPNEQLRLEDIAAMKDELAKIAVAVGRSKADGLDCDWFELADDVAALAAGVPKGWDVYRLGNSDDLLVVSPPDGSSVTLSPQGTGLASQLLYQLATTLMGGPKL